MTRARCLAKGFRDVDGNPDIGKLSACLQFMEGLPSFAAYKRRSMEMMQLKSGDTVVDLGCGLGFDVQKLAELIRPNGKAVGVDNSTKLLEAAGRAFADVEGAEFMHSDIHQLPFESDSIDSLRVGRVLQHVENPQKVISEMTRASKPGGRLVCAEPDWFTFVIDSDDIDTTNEVIGRWRSSFRNPCIGRQLLRRIITEGLQNTWVEGFVLLASGLEAVDIVYDIFATTMLLEEENKENSYLFSSWLNSTKRPQWAMLRWTIILNSTWHKVLL
ncbi:MAG: methyltransferase domain-containing protein [Syntrophobacteraceae bacterium]